MVHAKIKEYLRENGIRQVFVADKAGIDRSVFNLMINGKRRIPADTLVDICDVLNIDMNLFRGDADQEPEAAGCRG